MSQEIFELVKGMDFKKIETQLALQCAPLIMGQKVWNLFIIPAENERGGTRVRSTQESLISGYFGRQKRSRISYIKQKRSRTSDREHPKDEGFLSERRI